jgi:glycine/D-amino acid oxidase-like deaminating enzyme
MTRIKYGSSPWVDEFPSSRRLDLPRFRGEGPESSGGTLPTVIVGGGLTGCCTAYALAAAGMKVILLEAHRLGLGGTSRSPGVLQGEASPSFKELEDRHGRRAARAMFEASRRAVLDFASTVRRLGIKAGVDVDDALRVVQPYSGNEKLLARETMLRKDAGLEAVSLKPAVAARESRVDRSPLAVRYHDWGYANPYRLVQGFARAASDRGALLFERSPVKRIKVARKHVDVVTDRGIIAAETVVVCTGEPTDLFRPLKRHVTFAERYAVLTDRVPAAIRKQLPSVGIVTDTNEPPHVIRWQGDHLLMSGADQSRTPARTRDKVLVQRTGQLMYELLRMYPAISGLMPTYGWEMPIATAADGAMFAGPHRNYPRHLFAWATRHDPAQAFLASRIIVRHVSGETDKSDAFFAFTRG